MQHPVASATWREAVEAYLESRLPDFPAAVPIAQSEIFGLVDAAACARSALVVQLADITMFGLKDLQQIHSRAHAQVGGGSSRGEVEGFLADLASHRQMLAKPAHLIESLIDDWAGRFHRYLIDFVANAQAELAALAPSHDASRASPQVRSLEFFRSDPHDDAFGTIAVELSGDAVWYYKPRSDAADRAAAHLFDELGRRFESPVPVRVPHTRAFGDHHWSREIAPHAIDNERQLAQAAEELGCFAAIAYVFNFNDLHFENVLLSSPLALVDAETAFVPTPRQDGPLKDPALPYKDRIAYELVRTGLVPTWKRAGFDSEWDITPLGSHGEFKLDGFEPGSDPGRWTPSSFGNKVTDLALSTVDYGAIVRPAFLKGFRAAFLRVLASKQALGALADDVVQPASRCILRQTHFYARIMEKSLHPQVLFGLQDRKAFIRQCLEAADDRRAILPDAVRDYEVSSLDRLSIPNFHADCRGTALSFDGRSVEAFFAETAVAEIRTRLDRSTTADLETLEGCIDMQFKKRFAPHELAHLR
jgi:hypothetical protein